MWRSGFLDLSGGHRNFQTVVPNGQVNNMPYWAAADFGKVEIYWMSGASEGKVKGSKNVSRMCFEVVLGIQCKFD